MLAKLAVLLHSKIALAIVGAVFVAGTGAAVATATGATSHLPNAFFAQNGSQHAEGTHTPGDHDATKTPEGNKLNQEQAGKISAIDAAGSNFTLTIIHWTGDDQSDKSDDHATPTAKPTPKTTPTTSSLTVKVTADTKYGGAAKSFAELKVGLWVEVGGATQSDGIFLASKVNVVADNGEGDDHNQQHEGGVYGAIVTIGGSSFTVKGVQNTVTVTVATTTKFVGVKGIADLKAGMRVAALGVKQSDGSIAAQGVVILGDGHGD